MGRDRRRVLPTQRDGKEWAARRQGVWEGSPLMVLPLIALREKAMMVLLLLILREKALREKAPREKALSLMTLPTFVSDGSAREGRLFVFVGPCSRSAGPDRPRETPSQGRTTARCLGNSSRICPRGSGRGCRVMVSSVQGFHLSFS